MGNEVAVLSGRCRLTLVTSEGVGFVEAGPGVTTLRWWPSLSGWSPALCVGRSGSQRLPTERVQPPDPAGDDSGARAPSALQHLGLARRTLAESFWAAVRNGSRSGARFQRAVTRWGRRRLAMRAARWSARSLRFERWTRNMNAASLSGSSESYSRSCGLRWRQSPGWSAVSGC